MNGEAAKDTKAAKDIKDIKGLELSRRYYEAYGRDMIARTVPPEIAGRLTVGLVGEGSQCFGFDDAISQDHDFAPGFCIWMEDADYEACGAELQRAYDALPASFLGFSRDNVLAAERLGVMTVCGFYSRFTASPTGVPQSGIDWLLTPEHQLAAATNGEIFAEGTGHFSEIRRRLLDFYPEDVRRKKIAARAAIMSQAGQYNLLRVIRRQDGVAAMLALGRFTEAALSMIYLLNRRYMPFYKWAFHGLSDLPRLAGTCGPLLEQSLEIAALLRQNRFEESHQLAFDVTEGICAATAEELRRQGISKTGDQFLQNHLGDIMSGIQDPQLRKLPPMMDCAN